MVNGDIQSPCVALKIDLNAIHLTAEHKDIGGNKIKKYFSQDNSAGRRSRK